MQKQVFSRPEALSPVQEVAATQEVNNMKKIIATLGITAVLAISALVIGFNGTQFSNAAQDGQTNINSYHKNLMMAGGGSNWSGG